MLVHGIQVNVIISEQGNTVELSLSLHGQGIIARLSANQAQELAGELARLAARIDSN